MKVPQIDLVRQYKLLKAEIDGKIEEVLSSGSFIMGPWVAEIEKAVAALSGVKHGIGVGSGTEALELCLLACGVGPGDEVITSPFSFVSVAEVAVRMGAKPVFGDIDPRTYTMEARHLAKRITSRTKAIVPVHLYGLTTDMDALNDIAGKKGIPVVEDACQAVGAKYKGRPAGSLGTMACLSFYPTKNLGCCGDGGMVLTDRDDVRARVASLRVHGQSEKYKYRDVGVNSRLDSIQAAVLLAKVGRLADWNEKRRAIAARYDRLLGGLPVETPHVPDYAYHSYHQYTIKAERRDDLQAFLREKGVGTAVHYPMGIHVQEAFEKLGCKAGDFPNVEAASKKVLSLPMFPELEEAEVEYVAQSIREFYRR